MLKAIAKKEVNCNKRVAKVWKKEANAHKMLRKARQDLADNKVDAHHLQHFKLKDIKSRYENDSLKKKVQDLEKSCEPGSNIST
jgi:hypothetical protein